jgi:hypothetical protein
MEVLPGLVRVGYLRLAAGHPRDQGGLRLHRDLPVEILQQECVGRGTGEPQADSASCAATWRANASLRSGRPSSSPIACCATARDRELSAAALRRSART